MADIQVEAIVEELTREQARLRDRLTALKAELAEIEAALARVTGALDSLRGREKAKRTRRPAASKQDVIELVAEVLSENQPLRRDALRQEVEQRVLASGKSRMGLALRFKEALREAQFVATASGIQLDDYLPPEQLSA
jgi:sugar-specific transcriptional regulator TrmB